MAIPNYASFPNLGNPHMLEGMLRYLEHGILPGSFLQAVLRNDLKGAVENADQDNKWLLADYIIWLYNNAPNISWGSPQIVADFVASFKKEPIQ